MHPVIQNRGKNFDGFPFHFFLCHCKSFKSIFFCDNRVVGIDYHKLSLLIYSFDLFIIYLL